MFTRRVSLAILGMLAPLVASEDSNRAELEREGVQLISQLEDAGRDIGYHADRLNSFTTDDQISKWTHSHHLEQIKSLVKEGLRPALKRLTEIQPQLPAWQRGAIDQMLLSALALAADVDSAILAKKEAVAVPPIMNAEYQALIFRIYEHAGDLVEASNAAGDYASAHLQSVETGLKARP
jgi:hypothetical protein